jgi:hypothetical protein
VPAPRKNVSVVSGFDTYGLKQKGLPCWGDLLQTVYSKDLFLIVLLLELLNTTGCIEEHLLACEEGV